MGIFVVDSGSGLIRKSEDVQLADRLVQMRKNKDHWEVIEEIIFSWIEREKEDFMGFKVYLDGVRETRIDKKFGSTPDKDFDRRMIMMFPMKIQQMIRSLYTAQELPFDKKFFREFARRFEFFKIPEKI